MDDPSINLEGDEKPRVLVLKASPAFSVLGFDSLDKFELLKAFESPLPLDQYLTAHGRSVQALLISGSCPATAKNLRLLPSLRVIVTSSTGLNQIDLAECRRRGIAIANAGTSYTEDVSDAAVGLLIGVLRKVTTADRFVRKGLWPVHECYPLGSKVSVLQGEWEVAVLKKLLWMTVPALKEQIRSVTGVLSEQTPNMPWKSSKGRSTPLCLPC